MKSGIVPVFVVVKLAGLVLATDPLIKAFAFRVSNCDTAPTVIGRSVLSDPNFTKSKDKPSDAFIVLGVEGRSERFSPETVFVWGIDENFTLEGTGTGVALLWLL